MNIESRPHILHIITGLNDGGAEAVLYRLCLHDRASSHHVVSLMDSGKYGPLLRELGVPVTVLGMRRSQITMGGLFQLWRLVRKLQPDVIQTWMYHANLIGGLVGRLAGTCNIVWGIHHAILMPGDITRSTAWVSQLCALLSRWLPRYIVCCAEKSRNAHVSNGYNSARMVVIPNGYDLTVFRPNLAAGGSVRKELGIDPTIALIGCVARFDPLKDHTNLLRSLVLLKAQGLALQCLLVGTGMDPCNTRLISMIADLELEDCVHLVGRRDDIPSIMNALDLHVMSSFSEAFPNVLAEAMACGTPCVSTNVGDAPAILGSTGLIVPPRSPEALAEAISLLLAERDTPHLWRNRKEAARRHITEQYSLNRMVHSYRKVWSY